MDPTQSVSQDEVRLSWPRKSGQDTGGSDMRCDGKGVLWDFRVRGLSFGTVVFICSMVGGWVGQTVDAPVGPWPSERRSAPKSRWFCELPPVPDAG